MQADDADSVRVIRGGLGLGVTLLDTAMSYGQGHNERLIARALRSHVESALVATKFGIVRDAGGVRVNGRPEHVRGFCEASLRRLERDVIDLWYLHRVNPDVPVADTVGAMAALVTEGKVRYLGLSEAPPAQLAQAAAVHPVSAVQFEWSLLWREPEDDVVRPPGGWASAWCPTARSAAACLPPPWPGQTSTPATSAAPTRASTARPWTATCVTSPCCATWPPGPGSRRASSPWPGCSPRAPTSSPSPAAAARTGSRRTPPRPGCG